MPTTNPPTPADRLAAIKACVTGCGCDSVVCHGHEWDEPRLTALLAADPPKATVEIVCACRHVKREHLNRDASDGRIGECWEFCAPGVRCRCSTFTPTTARVSYTRALTEEERER